MFRESIDHGTGEMEYWSVVIRWPALRSSFHYSSTPILHYSEINTNSQAHGRLALFLLIGTRNYCLRVSVANILNRFFRAPHPPKRGRNGGEMEYFYDELTRPCRITIPWVDKYICTKKSDCSLLALNGTN